MTQRMLHLLGELKRHMNGAVVGSMRYYGAEYGLNYGVSIPTIRHMGQQQSYDSRFAEYLFAQHIRELKLLALWFADPAEIASPQRLDVWAQGIINSEVAQEAAFVLLSGVEHIEAWLYRDQELLQYAALMALSWREGVDMAPFTSRLVELLEGEPKLLPKGVVALMDGALRCGERDKVLRLLEELPHNTACSTIREEMEWRILQS